MRGMYGIRGLTVVMGLLVVGAAHAQEPAVENGAGAVVGVAPPVQGGDSTGLTPPPAAPTQAPAQPAPQTVVTPTPSTAPPAGITPPPDYIIGPDDILNVVFWRDKEMSSDVVVRPDGQITLPLINDVQAGGLTPDQLRAGIHKEASKFIEDPRVSVVVKQINSRRVFVIGLVGKPGAYPLSNPTTVLQLLSMAGGVGEFADHKKIIVMRNEDGTQKALKFNYKDVIQGKNLKQNILLQPGDTVVVP
jgi:polysaccharide export outer membrane protein